MKPLILTAEEFNHYSAEVLSQVVWICRQSRPEKRIGYLPLDSNYVVEIGAETRYYTKAYKWLALETFNRGFFEENTSE
jgi:hypothetical protein